MSRGAEPGGVVTVHYVDGNAISGALSLALGREAATITLECAGCGDRHRVAETRVYLRCPGQVIRCPSCEMCEIVLVDRPGRLQLTLVGLRRMDFS